MADPVEVKLVTAVVAEVVELLPDFVQALAHFELNAIPTSWDLRV